jgi:signal peptidase II
MKKSENISFLWPLIVIISILVLDQSFKFFIKLNYPLSAFIQPAIIDLGFFKLLFVENKGMAMGAKLNDFIPFLSDKNAKLFLTLFRLIAIVGIGYWLWKSINKKSLLLSWALCLIFAGALGNIIDSVFYGVIFSHSYGQVASFMPENGGYASFFLGHVVDMLQFPLFSWEWPKWLPWIGGDSYTFFQYVFNIADTSISSGVGILIFFNKRIFDS